MRFCKPLVSSGWNFTLIAYMILTISAFIVRHNQYPLHDDTSRRWGRYVEKFAPKTSSSYPTTCNWKRQRELAINYLHEMRKKKQNELAQKEKPNKEHSFCWKNEFQSIFYPLNIFIWWGNEKKPSFRKTWTKYPSPNPWFFKKSRGG
jgi:hypothetical protein